MTIKIQVKDGLDATTTYNVGVTPIASAFDGICPSAHGCGYTNGNTWTNAVTGMGNNGWQTAGALPVNQGGVQQGCFQTGIAPGTMSPMLSWNTNALQSNHLATQATVANARLCDIVAKVGMIDSFLARNIAGIGAQCIATANRIGRLAMIDLELARDLSRLAVVDFPAAVGLSNLALANPIAARMQLQRNAAALGLNDVALLNTAAHQASIANVLDDGNAYRVVVTIPGVLADAVDVLVTDGTLVITVMAQATQAGVMQTRVRSFANQSRWTREFAIGQDVCIDAIDAIVANGMLTVVLPKKAALNNVVGNTVAARMSEVAVC